MTVPPLHDYLARLLGMQRAPAQQHYGDFVPGPQYRGGPPPEPRDFQASPPTNADMHELLLAKLARGAQQRPDASAAPAPSQRTPLPGRDAFNAAYEDMFPRSADQPSTPEQHLYFGPTNRALRDAYPDRNAAEATRFDKLDSLANEAIKERNAYRNPKPREGAFRIGEK